METTNKEMAELDAFVKSVSSAVDKFACFGSHKKENPCVYCNVRRICKEQSPRRANNDTA